MTGVVTRTRRGSVQAGGVKLTRVMVNLPPALLVMVDAEADRRRCARTDVVRALILDGLTAAQRAAAQLHTAD